jgi:hypothetical protein
MKLLLKMLQKKQVDEVVDSVEEVAAVEEVAVIEEEVSAVHLTKLLPLKKTLKKLTKRK